MSRPQNRSGVATLPAIRYEDTEPRDTVVAQLEDRLAQQERTTRSLIDHAFRVKNDVIASLGSARGSWQAESEARELLQEHIRAITDVVRKLSRDIQFLDAQIKERDGVNLGTQQVVKNLELQHVAGVTDLRARVERCDAFIARLTTDLKTAFDSIHTVAQKQDQQQSQIIEKMHQLENKIQVIKSGLDRVTSEHSMQLQHVESGTAHQLTGIDVKTKAQVDELKANIQASRSIEQIEREKLEARIMQHIDRTLVLKETKMEKLKSKHEEDLAELKRVVSKLEEELSKEKERTASIQRVLQSQSQQDNVEARFSRQANELARLKRDLLEGFDAIRQSIEDMKEMVEVRRQLMEEQVQKEILQMRKMMIRT